MTQNTDDHGEFEGDEEVLDALDGGGEPGRAPSHRRLGRRAAVATGIAVALGAGGYGVAVAASSSNAGSNGTAVAGAPAGFNAGAHPGCGTAFARGVSGTLKSESGSTLSVRAPDNSTHTVSTSASTTVVRIASGTLADVANGDQVLVSGTSASGTIQAAHIAVGTGLGPNPSPKSVPPGVGKRAGAAAGIGVARGTVADKSASGFTVVASDGTRVSVHTSSSVAVSTSVKITVSALRVGSRVTAAGPVSSTGTVSATQIEEIDSGAAAWPGFGLGAGRGGSGPLGVKPSTRPSGLPSRPPGALPQGTARPNGGNGLGFRGHGQPGQTCASTSPSPSATSSGAAS